MVAELFIRPASKTLVANIREKQKRTGANPDKWLIIPLGADFSVSFPPLFFTSFAGASTAPYFPTKRNLWRPGSKRAIGSWIIVQTSVIRSSN